MSPETCDAKNGDVFIAYQVTGQGADTMCLPRARCPILDIGLGIPAPGGLLQRLSAMFRLIRFDKRGTGLSDRPRDGDARAARR